MGLAPIRAGASESAHNSFSGLLISISIRAFSCFFLLRAFKGFLFMFGCQGIEPRLAPLSGAVRSTTLTILVPAATDQALYGRTKIGLYAAAHFTRLCTHYSILSLAYVTYYSRLNLICQALFCFSLNIFSKAADWRQCF